MTPLICWSRAEIQVATQIDVGGLEVGKPSADAVFAAIHQSVPIAKLRKAGADSDTAVMNEQEVLTDFARELASNEPHILFVTGDTGTGKSHLVRWLRSSVGLKPDWHIVYVEKRNTSLRRVIEEILRGVDTPRAMELRKSLALASASLSSPQEAAHALMAKLEQLVKFDDAPSVGHLNGPALTYMRKQAARLIGDFTFRRELGKETGAIFRLTKLAMDGTPDDEDVDESTLHISPDDLKMDPADFEETGNFLKLVKTVNHSVDVRRDIAALLDHYLARAKAEVFMGQSTDLQMVFEEVRQVVASQGKELCLFIEDLVLLHGIDTQLAQALTIPARSDLCKIRAAIAVTSGYLKDFSTFATRGVHYTMNVPRSEVSPTAMHDFVGRYLNAGRVGETALAAWHSETPTSPVPNKCDSCPVQVACHTTFGKSQVGHGLYPFNAIAIDRLTTLASPTGFDPRTILREAVREPLEVAEAELQQPSVFPSAAFARTLDDRRKSIPPERRLEITRDSPNPESELSLRAFYAENPGFVDPELAKIGDYLSVHFIDLSDFGSGGVESAQSRADEPVQARESEIDKWLGGKLLSAGSALKIRKWIIATVAAQLQSGPSGYPVRKQGSNWQIGSHTLRLTDVKIEKAGGGGNLASAVSLNFAVNDADAVLLKGVLNASTSGDLGGVNGGEWYFEIQNRLDSFERAIVEAIRQVESDAASSLRILAVRRNIAVGERATVLADILSEPARTGLHNAAQSFLGETQNHRDYALQLVRDRLTYSKGDGAPTLFDSGGVNGLGAVLTTLQLKEPYVGSPETVRQLEGAAARQLAASRAAWRAANEAIDKLLPQLPPTEDLAIAFESVDRVVRLAHEQQKLPTSDARDSYFEMRKLVTPDAFATFRRLAGHHERRADPSAADLIEVAVDFTEPLSNLTNLTAYADFLLSRIAEKTSTVASNPGDGDRPQLDTAFRRLVSALEIIGGRS